MARRCWRGIWVFVLVGMASGCGGPTADQTTAPTVAGGSTTRKSVVFVGFDASEPLVDAMRQGKIQGLVVQNPLKMGELSVKDDGQASRKTGGRTPDLDR